MGLTDQHLVYGDDIPQTQIEKDYYWKIKHLEEQNNKLKEAIAKIKKEIELIKEAEEQIHGCDSWNFVYKVEDVIDTHLREIDNG